MCGSTRSRTESIVGRDTELEVLLRSADRARPDPDGPPLRRRRRRQDPPPDRGARPARRATAGAPWSVTVSTSARPRCPTSRSPRCSARSVRSPPSCDERAPPRAGPAAPPRAGGRGLREPRPRRGVRGDVRPRRGPRRARSRRARRRGRPLGRRQHPRPDQLPALAADPGSLPGRGHLPLRRDAPPPPAAQAGRRVGARSPASSGSSSTRSRPAPCAAWSSRSSAGPAAPSARSTTTTSSASCSVRRATPSTSRSSSAPSWAAAGACPRTWPTCCSCGSTGSTSRRATSSRVASAAGQRVPHDLLARVAPVDRGPARGGAAPRPSTPTCSSAPGDSEYAFRHALLGEAVYDDLLPGERMRLHTAYAEAVRELHGRRQCRQPRPARARLPRPADRPARPASRRATRRWPPVVPTRRPATTPRPWRSTPSAAAHLDDPPDEAELVARTVDALCSSGRPETALALIDSHLAPAPGGRAAAVARPAAAGPRRGAPLDRDRRAARAWSAARRSSWSVPSPPQLRARILVDARPGADLGRQLRRGPRARPTRPSSSPTSSSCRGWPPTSGVTLTWLSQHLDLGEGSRAELKRIIAEAQARGDVLSEMRGYLRCGGLEYDYGELAAAQSNFLEAARLAREIGRPWTIQGIAGRMQGASDGLHARGVGRSPGDRRLQPRGPTADPAGDARGGRAGRRRRPRRRLGAEPVPRPARTLAPRGPGRRHRRRRGDRAPGHPRRGGRRRRDVRRRLAGADPPLGRELRRQAAAGHPRARGAGRRRAPHLHRRAATRSARPRPGWSPTPSGCWPCATRTSDRSRSRDAPGRPGCAPRSCGSSGCSAARSTSPS